MHNNIEPTRRVVLCLTLAAMCAASVIQPRAWAQTEGDIWSEFETLWNQVSSSEWAPAAGQASSVLGVLAQTSSRMYAGEMKLSAQALDFNGRPVGRSEHLISSEVFIGPPAGSRFSSGQESNELNLSIGSATPGQASPYDLWIRSADVFSTSGGSLMLQYWHLSPAGTRNGAKSYEGVLRETHMAAAAVWNQLMIPTQIYPNAPQMQFPQPLDVGAQLGLILGDQGLAVVARGTASNGQYPFSMELYAERVR